jgi:D-3-phosphoglycerate dehydrogenase
MGFKVAIVSDLVMLSKNLPKNIEATGAESSIYTSGETEDKLISICSDADCIITSQGSFPFTPKVFKGLPKCKFLITVSIGYDAIDVPAVTELGIGIVNLRGFCSEELAEHAMALMLACVRLIVTLNNRVKAGQPVFRGIDEAGKHMTILKGKTLGLVGFGNAGRLMVPKARGFEMNILAFDPYVDKNIFKKLDVRQVDLDTLLAESDFISIHASLTKESRHLIGLEQFKKMKRSTYIVNTSRGGIIDGQALCTALSEGYIAGAGLDVTDPEPVPLDSPLKKFDNVILTGHHAGSSLESSIVWGMQPAEEVSRMMRGEWPIGLVNPEVKKKYMAKWGKMSEPRGVK